MKIFGHKPTLSAWFEVVARREAFDGAYRAAVGLHRALVRNALVVERRLVIEFAGDRADIQVRQCLRCR